MYNYCPNVLLHRSDIDECDLDRDECAMSCTNTIGSYTCGCTPGFLLEDDGKDCSGEGVLGVGWF